MSIQALNWALAQDQIKNTGTKFVLLILCNYADETGQCYPSRETIAKKTAMSVRSVQRHINWLAENGFLTWSNEFTKDNRQSANVYQLPGDKLAHLPQKPSANPAKAECQMEQKPGDTVAQNTSVREPSFKHIPVVFEFPAL